MINNRASGQALAPNTYVSGVGSIQGWIYTSNADGYLVPVSSARITVHGPVNASTVTAMNGDYVIYLPPGTYVLTVSAAEYASKTTVVRVTNGVASEVDMQLTPRTPSRLP